MGNVGSFLKEKWLGHEANHSTLSGEQSISSTPAETGQFVPV